MDSKEKKDNFWGGDDSDGKKYAHIDEIWKNIKTSQDLNEKWYKPAEKYWEKEEATDDGVLGSYGFLNDLDINDSEKVIDELMEKGVLKNDLAIDCGAGIGRITKNLLCKKFKTVDIEETNPFYLKKAIEELKGKNIGNFYSEGLQNFFPSKIYDCFWIQWVSPHLTDQDYVDFLKRCSNNLSDKGIIFVKENISNHGFSYDLIDSSVTRSKFMFKELFKRAGLKIVMEKKQRNFPSELFSVLMFALQKEK